MPEAVQLDGTYLSMQKRRFHVDKFHLESENKRQNSIVTKRGVAVFSFCECRDMESEHLSGRDQY